MLNRNASLTEDGIMAKKATSYIRRLHPGDMFNELGEVWELTREPKIENDTVVVYLKHVPAQPKSRARKYVYGLNARVAIAS